MKSSTDLICNYYNVYATIFISGKFHLFLNFQHYSPFFVLVFTTTSLLLYTVVKKNESTINSQLGKNTELIKKRRNMMATK